jgi:hypothetical protein
MDPYLNSSANRRDLMNPLMMSPDLPQGGTGGDDGLPALPIEPRPEQEVVPPIPTPLPDGPQADQSLN